jgi:hypothetical protein
LWKQNPFIDNEDDNFELTTIEKEKLIEVLYDSSLKQKFQNQTLIQFWMNLNREYESLYYKTMQVALSTLRPPPRFNKLCANKQQ